MLFVSERGCLDRADILWVANGSRGQPGDNDGRVMLRSDEASSADSWVGWCLVRVPWKVVRKSEPHLSLCSGTRRSRAADVSRGRGSGTKEWIGGTRAGGERSVRSKEMMERRK